MLASPALLPLAKSGLHFNLYLAQNSKPPPQLIIQRLEAESQAVAEAARSDEDGRHADALAALTRQARDAQRGEERMAERFRAATQAAAASDARAEEAARATERLRAALEEREGAAAAAARAADEARAEAAAARRAAGSEATRAHDALTARLQVAAGERALLEARCGQLAAELAGERGRHAAEMRVVGERVKGAVAQKDRAIAALRSQLDAAVGQLRGTEALLAEGRDTLLMPPGRHGGS